MITGYWAPQCAVDSTNRSLAAALGRCGVDRFHVPLDLVPVLSGREPKCGAPQVNDAGVYDRLRPNVADHPGQTLQSVADHEERVLDPAVAQTVSTLIQNLAPSPPVPAARDMEGAQVRFRDWVNGVFGGFHQWVSAAGNRSPKVIANAFNGGFVRREAP